MNRFTIEPGTRDDYLALRDHHYATGEPATFAAVLRAHWANILAAVLVVSHPTLNADWRAQAFGKDFAQGDNAAKARLTNLHVRTISRVIVDPRFRGNGIATALVRQYLHQSLTRCTEAVSVLNAFVPLFESAGMRRMDLAPSQRDRELLSQLHDLHLTPLDLATLAASCGLSTLNQRTLKVLHPELLRWGQAHRATRRYSCPTTLARHAARSLLLPRVVFVRGSLASPPPVSVSAPTLTSPLTKEVCHVDVLNSSHT